MPFPPTFDRAWDETFPPDTQLANLLGQDIRNFKTDIRERLSLLSGTLANRPANMDAIYGGAGFGILYFATDTSQIFQWNGSAWVQASGIGVTDYADYGPVSFIAAAPGNIRTLTLPIGAIQSALAIGSYIEIKTSHHISGVSGANPVYNLTVNGVSIFSQTFSVLPVDFFFKAYIALSSATVPRSFAHAVSNTSVAPAQRTAAALGTTDGTVAVPLVDSWSASTTISATSDYMQVRIRK